MSKIINLKLDIYQEIEKEEKIKILNKINLKNFIYYLEIKYNTENIIIVAFEDTNNIKNDYKIIFQFFKKIYLNDNNFSIIGMSWKNQFLVSPIIDFYGNGLTSNVPISFKSLKRDIKTENELNKKIFFLINIWLKQYGDESIIINKINFLNEK